MLSISTAWINAFNIDDEDHAFITDGLYKYFQNQRLGYIRFYVDRVESLFLISRAWIHACNTDYLDPCCQYRGGGSMPSIPTVWPMLSIRTAWILLSIMDGIVPCSHWWQRRSNLSPGVDVYFHQLLIFPVWMPSFLTDMDDMDPWRTVDGMGTNYQRFVSPTIIYKYCCLLAVHKVHLITVYIYIYICSVTKGAFS